MLLICAKVPRVTWHLSSAPHAPEPMAMRSPRPQPSSSYWVLRRATTPGSASVVVSPRTRPSAISRSRRRMIFALRVLGSSDVKKMSSGRAMEPILATTCRFNSSLSVSLGGNAFFQGDKRRDTLPLHFMRLADHRRFRYRRVIHQRAFDLVRRDAVPGHVHHIVHAPHQPEIAVGIHLATVPSEVNSRVARPKVLLSRSGPGRRRWCASSPPARASSAPGSRQRRGQPSPPGRQPPRPRRRETAASPSPAWSP